MPVYNAGSYLESAIQSVLDQTFTDFELILVDDGSTDGSPTVCQEAAKRDCRVRSFAQANAGPGAAMNTGIRAARGAWVAVMHADDLMLPVRLSSLDEALKGEIDRIGLITSSVELIGANGKSLGKGVPDLPSNPFFLRDGHAEHIVGGLYHPAVALSRAALDEIGGYNPECRLNEDVELFNRLVEHGYGILILPETLMKYRIHGSAASSAKDRTLLLHWRYLKSVIRDRRAGRPSATWEAYLATRRELPLLTRVNEWRKDHAKIHYRRAAGALSSRRKIAFALHSIYSAVLQPSFILNRWLIRR
jgi:glycosyltransferase involved in cell wall biosynthesis